MALISAIFLVSPCIGRNFFGAFVVKHGGYPDRLGHSDWAKAQLKPPLLVSDDIVKWNGLALYHFRNQKMGQLDLPPLSEHLIVVHLANPSSLALRASGEWSRARSVPGSLSILEANQDNIWEWDEEIDEIHIFLDAKILDAASEELLGKRVNLINGVNISDPWIYQIGLQLLMNIQSPCITTGMFGNLIAQNLSLQLLRNHVTETRRKNFSRIKISRPRLQRALDYIENNLAIDLKVDDVANVVGMSAFHFAHCFRESMGIAPHKYLIKRRIERAAEMLRHTVDPISQIALSVGFPNQSHFTTVFRRLIGSTPFTYRMNSSI